MTGLRGRRRRNWAIFSMAFVGVFVGVPILAWVLLSLIVVVGGIFVDPPY